MKPMSEFYPVSGTVEVDGNVSSWDMEEAIEYLTNHENGRIDEQIRNDIRANLEEGTEYEFTVYANGRYDLSEADQ